MVRGPLLVKVLTLDVSLPSHGESEQCSGGKGEGLIVALG